MVPKYTTLTNGTKLAEQTWRQGLPVGIAKSWAENGKVLLVQETDDNGDGTYTSYHKDGKKIRATGPVKAGKRNGHWIMKDETGVLSMEAEYVADSAVKVLCYDENGEVEKKQKDCTVEKAAEFRGGANGWRKYLEKNLKYPEYAQKYKIEGVVKIQFIVEKDGSVSEAKILSAPDETLGREALRMITDSPNWEPAVQYNRRVIYRHIQSITFRLQ